MPRLLTYSQIEKIYGLRKSTLTKLAMNGKFIDMVKIGNRNYFEVEALDQWIESRTVKVGP